MTAELKQRLLALHDAVGRGEALAAFEEYYAEDVVMQENQEPPVAGKAENRAREEAWLATVAEFKGFELLSYAVEGDTSFAETEMRYTDKDGNEVHQVQVARARWRDGRIVDECFYHG